MKRMLLLLAILAICPTSGRADDVRLQPPKDLNGYFPFEAPSSLTQWEQRKEQVRRQILVAAGIWPLPTKTPLNAVIHGKIDRGEYTVEKVYFQSVPGFFVTGNLYRPKQVKGKVPGILSAHGHAKDARLQLSSPDRTRQAIAQGAERFEAGGLSIYQSRCVQLARMGCVVWQWDMLSDSDSVQIPREVVHTFAKQRPEMNTLENWGLYSPQAESHCQNILGLQLLNSMRGADFLLSLPEVDPTRLAITGESGGGTQTMLLAAVDDRIALSFPVVMVSTSMQGGCTCENASMLRINTGNVEFAALFAPKPQGMNTANDWTKEMATKGFPDLQALYTLYGKKDNALLLRGEHFPHNYNAVTRSAFYTFLNKHFKLGLPSPVVERDFEPLSREQLTVWDSEHPAPKAGDPQFERALLKWLTEDANQQLRAAAATDDGVKNLLRPAVETLIGRSFAAAGTVEWAPGEQRKNSGYLEQAGTLRNTTYNEEVSVAWRHPQQHNGRVVIWLTDNGKSALQSEHVTRLVQGGATVLGANLFLQGNEPIQRTRVVANPREFAGYTHGYNHALFAQRTHDVLTLVSFLRNSKSNPDLHAKTIDVAGWGSMGPVVAAARALAGDAIDRAALDTRGFRFGKVLDYRDPMFLPGGAKYLDVPGLLALGAPHPLWLAGEGESPAAVIEAYQRSGKADRLVAWTGDGKQLETAACEWLLK